MVQDPSTSDSSDTISPRDLPESKVDLDTLVTQLYDELKRLANKRFRGQDPSHTLQPTALVNEAILKLRMGNYSWQDPQHFLGFASRAMRSILVDHARSKGRDKNKPTGQRVFLDDLTESYEANALDLVALDEALDRLSEVDPMLVELVELRFFVGLTMPEIARQLNRPMRTLEHQWTFARKWLHSQLSK